MRAKQTTLESKPESWPGRRSSVGAGARSAPRPSPGAASAKTAHSWRGILRFTHLAREGRMTVTIGRRELLAAIGGAAAWPLAARAQQPAMPVVGLLHSSSTDTSRLRAFRQGLKDTGFIEGENVAIEYRSANDQTERLSGLAAELVQRRVAVIAAIGGIPPALAAKAATTTIPIVCLVGMDPVRLGLVASLARPGGNLTGINILSTELASKRLELLRALVPGATRIAVLVDPTNAAGTDSTLRDVGA